jgi:hypothetical protein
VACEADVALAAAGGAGHGAEGVAGSAEQVAPPLHQDRPAPPPRGARQERRPQLLNQILGVVPRPQLAELAEPAVEEGAQDILELDKQSREGLAVPAAGALIDLGGFRFRQGRPTVWERESDMKSLLDVGIGC